MANAQLNATLTGNASSITTALNQVNAGIQQINTNQQSFMKSAIDVGKSVVSNYMNILAILKDVSEYIDRAYKNQARFNALLNNANYKKYADQLDEIAKNTQNMNSVYNDYDSLQKLFNSNVDLSSGKLEELTKISSSYAKAMGIDGKEALQRFSEAIAESSTSKLEDLGLYIDSKNAVMEYAISLGISADELTKTQEKQAVLNAILKEGQVQTEGLINPLSQVRNEYGLMKKEIEGMVVAATDWAASGFNSWLESNRYYGNMLGEKLYDIVHAFDSVATVMEGDVIPAANGVTTAYQKMNKVMFDTIENNKILGSQGIITFQGISANNIKAIESTQKAYERAAAKWEKMQDTIMRNGIKRLERDYEYKKKLAIQQADFNYSLLEDGLVIDDNFFEATDTTKARLQNDEKLAKLDETLAKAKQERKDREREIEFLNQKKWDDKIYSYTEDSANLAYNKLIQGKTNFMQEMIAISMQKAGAEIFNDGLQGLWQGGRWALSPYPTMAAQGVAMVGYSLAEMGAGVALGYAGSKLMPSQTTSSEAKTKETAAMDRTNTKPQNQKTDVYLYPNEKPWLRRLNKSIKKIGSK